MTPTDEVTKLINEVWQELCRARARRPNPYASVEEGYQSVSYGFSDLKWAIGVGGSLASMRLSAIQVAAMALRFALDLCVEKGSEP